ncbi:MAG TPA: hypothetical protein ENI60_07490 [Candidatus Fraserbacteria bacterium]|nr:hypothetical protein [Candidatus Fraserbacteria bacterium]
MLLIWAIPLGIIIGYLRGGRLGNLAQIKLRGGWLILLALLIQLSIFPLGAGKPLITVGTEYLHLGSYLLLLFFVGLNWHEWGILAMGAGMALNLLVITLNGGYMPTTVAGLQAAGRVGAAAKLAGLGHYGNNTVIVASSQLVWLSDIFHTPAWLPGANVFSLGDLLLALGLIGFLQAKMRAGRS